MWVPGKAGGRAGRTGPTCGYAGLECCAGDECYGDRTTCDANNECVSCGEVGEICCQELATRSMGPGEQAGRCISSRDVCGSDGLCVDCGGEGEACCANSRCDGDGCCVGGVCVTNGTSCGDGLGTCTDGVCANCGAAEGDPCCEGSCGPDLGCNDSGICVCGGEGEVCCGTTCDASDLGCFRYICQPGTTECPATAPSQGEACDYLGTDLCRYPGSDPFVWDCLCMPHGWSCAA